MPITALGKFRLFAAQHTGTTSVVTAFRKTCSTIHECKYDGRHSWNVVLCDKCFKTPHAWITLIRDPADWLCSAYRSVYLAPFEDWGWALSPFHIKMDKPKRWRKFDKILDVALSRPNFIGDIFQPYIEGADYVTTIKLMTELLLSLGFPGMADAIDRYRSKPRPEEIISDTQRALIYANEPRLMHYLEQVQKGLPCSSS